MTHLAVLKANEHVLHLKDIFEENSCLKFTFETEKVARISFLEINVSRKDYCYITSVYVKPTNNGDCLNFESPQLGNCNIST